MTKKAKLLWVGVGSLVVLGVGLILFSGKYQNSSGGQYSQWVLNGAYCQRTNPYVTDPRLTQTINDLVSVAPRYIGPEISRERNCLDISYQNLDGSDGAFLTNLSGPQHYVIYLDNRYKDPDERYFSVLVLAHEFTHALQFKNQTIFHFNTCIGTGELGEVDCSDCLNKEVDAFLEQSNVLIETPEPLQSAVWKALSNSYQLGKLNQGSESVVLLEAMVANSIVSCRFNQGCEWQQIKAALATIPAYQRECHL